MKNKLPFLFLFFLLKISGIEAQKQPIALNWLSKMGPSVKTGISWGVPFKRGEVQPKEPFFLKDKEGKTLPLQTWTNAYWDDGSLKWLGLARVAKGDEKGFELGIGKTEKSNSISINITETPLSINVKNGLIACIIPKAGTILLDSMSIDNRIIGKDGHLNCLWQNGADDDFMNDVKKEVYKSRIQKVEIEQKGDVKTVIGIEGKMYNGQREWLPFNVRLYFYAGVENVRIMQTLIYDGDAEKDFIKGFGWQFDVPMREEVLNRHVRFGGETEGAGGIWSEPIQPLTGRRPLILDKKNVYEVG